MSNDIAPYYYKDIPEKPLIVCLCGSLRFVDTWKRVYREQSLMGRIVLSVSVLVQDGDTPVMDPALKPMLDELHLRRIDISDRILVINVNGYIGDSTRREIRYAFALNKEVRFLEFDKRPPIGWIYSNDPPLAEWSK